jgi:hypothetical protein
VLLRFDGPLVVGAAGGVERVGLPLASLLAGRDVEDV